MRHELNQMLTNGKMARVLGINPKTLRKWARQGFVPSYINRINGYRYYFKAEPGARQRPLDRKQGMR